MTDTHEDIHRRLGRMESKVDDLVGAITELVKLQVEQKSIVERLDSHSEGLKKLDGRLDEVEKKLPIYDLITGVAKRIGLIALTVVVGAVLALVIA